MHTANSLEAMAPDAACRIAENMARELFGTDRFKAALGELCGVKRQTVNNWFLSKPPVIAILYMQAELERRKAQAKLDNLRRAITALA